MAAISKLALIRLSLPGVRDGWRQPRHREGFGHVGDRQGVIRSARTAEASAAQL
jgi:hypothetical protein